jgi:hypothetical protein
MPKAGKMKRSGDDLAEHVVEKNTDCRNQEQNRTAEDRGIGVRVITRYNDAGSRTARCGAGVQQHFPHYRTVFR